MKVLNVMQKKSPIIRYALIALSGLFLCAVLDIIWQYNRTPTLYGGVIEPPKAMPGFTLQSSRGDVSLQDFKGKFVVLAFGYTSCPDVCPTVLADIRQAIAKLEPREAAQIQVIFVSVDYQRDTPEVVDAYVRNFDPNFLGLSGSQAQINQVTSDFGIYYKLNSPDPKTGFYSVDHSAVALVIDQTGALIMTWPFDMPADKIGADLRTLVWQAQR